MPETTHVFLCGIPAMIDEMIAILGKDGFREHSPRDPGQIHVERY
jgi:ferredoxin--NADP+ reductase